MSWLDRWNRMIGSDTAVHAALAALTVCYTACRQRAEALEKHAEAAPGEASAVALRGLASDEEAQASQLRQALHAAGATPPNLPALNVAASGTNHWARVVEDLEAHRQAEQHYRVLAMQFAESAPQTASLFESLCQEEHTHCERLRDLIARADPQALD